MDLVVTGSFWAVSMLFVLTPGVDWAYAIAVGLKHRIALPGVAGMLTGHLAATLVVAAGVGTLIAQLPLALTALTVVGSGYLIWLGATTIAKPGSIHAAAHPIADRPLHQFATGFGVSGLNPKVFLLFLALLPQFTRASGTIPVPAQLLILGLIHIANCALVYSLVAMAAQRVLRTRPAAARHVSRTSGIVMAVLGGWLLAEQLLH